MNDINVPPDQESPKHILNALNDHLIQIILKHLCEIEDFISAAEVCQRFQANARECFRISFKEWRISDVMYPCHRRNQLSPLQRLQNFLNIFGNLIQSLDFSVNFENYDEVFNMITDFCGPTLTQLRICHDLDFNTRTPLRALQKLELDGAKPINFNLHSQITELTLDITLKEPEDWLMRTFPNLKKAIFRMGFYDNLTDHTFIKFSSLNPQLEFVAISCSRLTSSIFNNIEVRLPNLASFGFRNNNIRIDSDDNFVHLGKLRKLKLLAFECNEIPTSKLIELLANHNSPVENLMLYPKCGGIEKSTPELKMLDGIALGSISDESLINLVKTQTRLEAVAVVTGTITIWGIRKALEYGKKLHTLRVGLKSNEIMDSNHYKSILSLARGHVMVTIWLENAHQLCTDIPADVLEANRKWINIV